MLKKSLSNNGGLTMESQNSWGNWFCWDPI